MDIEARTDERRKRAADADGKRLRLIARLDEEGESELSAVLERCNEPITLRCWNCTATTTARTRCNKRWCPSCARRLAAKRVARYTKAALMMKWPLHVTFTVRNTRDISRAHVKRLTLAFRALRKQHLWKNNVEGGIASVEVTNRGKGWHLHLHVLADVRWLSLKVKAPCAQDSRERKRQKCKDAARELGAAWEGLIGQDRASVKSRRCSGAEAVFEVLKYACKPEDLIESEENPADLIRAMLGTRWHIPFGTMYGKTKLLDAELEKRTCVCEECMEEGTMRPDFAETNHRRHERGAHVAAR